MLRIALLIVALLVTCGYVNAQTSTTVTITGFPLSMVYTSRPFESSFSNISIVLLVAGKRRIASANTGSPEVTQLTQLAALLEAEIADGDQDTITIDAEEYEPAAPDAVYPDPIFVRLTRLEVSGYSWGKLYLQ